MRITDPMWPAVREVARMLLRDDDLAVTGPKDAIQKFNTLVLSMADQQPDRLSFPKGKQTEDGDENITISGNQRVQFGGDEPGLDVIWLPMAAKDGWNSVIHAANDLLRAGYPGCLGCGGSNSESPWQESLHGSRMMETE